MSEQISGNGSLDERLRLTAHEQTYDVANLEEAATFKPDPYPVNVPIVRRHWKQRKDGGYDLTLIFDGQIDPEKDGDAYPEDFSLDGTTSQEPIEGHAGLRMLMEKYKGKVNAEGRVVFDRLMPGATPIPGVDGTISNPLFGRDVYYSQSLVWTWNFTTKNFPQDMDERLGTVDEPQVGREGQRPPQLSGKKNWLCVRAKADWRGNVWKCTMSWLSSDAGGWNEDMYRRGGY